MSRTIRLETDAQEQAFEDLLEAVETDEQDGFVDVDRAERGRNAGEVKFGGSREDSR